MTHTEKIPYCDPLHAFIKLREKSRPAILLESTASDDLTGRFSIIAVDPLLELTGAGETCTIRLLNVRGNIYMDFLKKAFSRFTTDASDVHLLLRIPKAPFTGSEEERPCRENIASVIRELLMKFNHAEKNFTGLYGAFSYQFIYLYEDIEKRNHNTVPDFRFFLFDTVCIYNHIFSTGEIISSSENVIRSNYSFLNDIRVNCGPTVTDIVILPEEAEFLAQVEKARELCRLGELMEVVFSRKLTAKFQGDPLPIYENYRAINPSPYMFFFDFGDEQLFGTSPEMMVRYENGRVRMRPISGTIHTAGNPVDEHHLLLELLNSPKEKSELDMLIDLARNDLARICKPGVKIDHYRILEKYSHLIHTVAEVSGEPEEGRMGYDALVSCLNAGTLTGAPKFAAMQTIENTEKHPRDYYGGAIGYLLFNGDVNTAITIRSAFVRNGELSFLAGATLLYESDPEKELNEVKIKSAGFLEALKPFAEKTVPDSI